MCRLVGWVSRTPMTLRDVLGEHALARFMHLSHVHADGWGAGWHDESGALCVTRSADPARTDPDFAELAAGLASTAAIVHLRLGTPGYGHGTRNSHPFTDGPWALAHNGAITPHDLIDRLLPPDATKPSGDTDTERYFLALRAHLDRTGSVPIALAAVEARIAEVGLYASSLNAMLLGPDGLHVISSHDPDWQATTTPVWPADELAAGTVPPYFPMSYRESDDAVIAVSSGIVSEKDGWTVVPNHSVYTVGVPNRRTASILVPAGETVR